MTNEGGQARIFIVDDEKEMVDALNFFVEKSGFAARGFTNPLELIKALDHEEPFLIFSDFRMPSLNGLELFAEVRKKKASVPFVLLTGYADKEMAIKGIENRISALIEKPFRYETILALIQKYAEELRLRLEKDQAEIAEIKELFIEEATELTTDLEPLIFRLEEDPIDLAVIDLLFRKIHSIKGGAGAIPGAEQLAKLNHDFESVLVDVKARTLKPTSYEVNLFLKSSEITSRLIQVLRAKEIVDADLQSEIDQTITALRALKNNQSQSNLVSETKVTQKVATAGSRASEENSKDDDGVWVNNDKLDSFMSLSGELIVLKNSFQTLGSDADLKSDPTKLEKKLTEFAYNLNKITDHLQEQIMSVRKITLDRALSKLPRIVRQAAQETNKRVRLQTNGFDLGVDKKIAKALSASMIHMIRNSVDHGVESQEKRLAAGKAAEGVVEISASESQGVIHIEMTDDGGGINLDRVSKKALENGLVDERQLDAMTDEEKAELIFHPGLSTAEVVSNVSGRGVGMDVVKSSILALNGRIRITTAPGKGTTFKLEIPIPKAVMVEQTVLVRWREVVFAIPLNSISNIMTCKDLQILEIGGKRLCQVDGNTLPIGTYEEVIKRHSLKVNEEIYGSSLVIISDRGREFGLIVDRVEEQLEAVIRPFDSVVDGIDGFKGTCVLGNEQIAYIVSPEQMVDLVLKHRGMEAA